MSTVLTLVFKLVGLEFFVILLQFVETRIKSKIFKQKQSVRVQLLFVAFSDLQFLIRGLIIFALTYFALMQGWLSGLSVFIDNHGNVPDFVLWMIEPSFLSLSLFFVGGFILGYFNLAFGLSVALATVFIFPCLISSPGAVLFVFGEMQGAMLRSHLCTKIDQPRKVFLIRLLTGFFAYLVFWSGGSVLQSLIASLNLNPMLLSDRLIEALVLICLLSGLDTLMAAVVFHFYHARTKDGNRINN